MARLGAARLGAACLGAALLAVLAGCTSEAPADAPRASDVWAEGIPSTLRARRQTPRVFHDLAWTVQTARAGAEYRYGSVWNVPDIAIDPDRRASLAFSRDVNARLDRYSWEFDSLFAGDGPEGYTAAGMDSLLADVIVGRFRMLHGAFGPSVEARYDLTGDRLSDRFVYSGSRYGVHGVLYTQTPRGDFLRAGNIDLGHTASICPNGDETATVRTFSAAGAALSGYGQTLRIGPTRIDTLAQAGFSLYDAAGTVIETESQTCTRLQRAATTRAPGCLLSSDFERGAGFGASAPCERDDAPAYDPPDGEVAALRVLADDDSVRVTVPAFSVEPFRWTLLDPSGAPRASGTVMATPRLVTAGSYDIPQAEHVFAARPGWWRVRAAPADVFGPGVALYSWTAPRLVR